ncbi:hypothetical protein TBK1r_29390 [Stieleria magnilauensis]|uniref:Uncharacterized protein n=1 Tax=Stieleria magnilauensis TaxID=2527963 RepID=A0ABX5XQ79_9BACT|nr:hypothetical protein TBK1r_29390 [Planctomycetes bacterium TBK1r]
MGIGSGNVSRFGKLNVFRSHKIVIWANSLNHSTTKSAKSRQGFDTPPPARPPPAAYRLKPARATKGPPDARR